MKPALNLHNWLNADFQIKVTDRKQDNNYFTILKWENFIWCQLLSGIWMT